MIFGENGNGKSSIADALISLCTDTIGSIRDKSSTDRSFIKSLGCSPNDVNIKLSTDSGTYSAQLNASGSTFIKTPNISFPTVRHLRRSHIIHLIDAEPSKRYEVLKDYIDVSSIIKSEDELRKAKKSADDAFYKINITISSATKAIETSWNTEGRSGNSWEEWAKSESGKDITEQIEIQKRYNALVALWNDISVKR